MSWSRLVKTALVGTTSAAKDIPVIAIWYVFKYFPTIQETTNTKLQKNIHHQNSALVDLPLKDVHPIKPNFIAFNNLIT